MHENRTSRRATQPLTTFVVLVALYELIGAGWLFADLVTHVRDLPHLMSTLTLAGMAVAAMGVVAALLLLLRNPVGKYLSIAYLALTAPMIGIAGHRLFLFGAGSVYIALITGDPASPGGFVLQFDYQLAPFWYLSALNHPGVFVGVNLLSLALLLGLILRTGRKSIPS